MKKTLVVFLTLVMLFTMVPVVMGGFEDAPKSSHWAYDNFILLYNYGLLKGYPDGTFKGERYATRYEMVELTARILMYLESRVEALTGIELPKGDGPVTLSEAQAKALIKQIMEEEGTATKADLDDLVNELYDAIFALEDEFMAELEARGDVDLSLIERRLNFVEQKVEEQEVILETVAKDAKTGKTLSIVGIILGVAGVIFGFVPSK
ncbi:MAG: S-layer homology domain-containing protein [Firmicutes bacterium]|nr:S-layer homology domain-containing protein [Bacillota bacterium]